MSWPIFNPKAYIPGEQYVIMSIEAYQRVAEFIFVGVDDLGICQVDIIEADDKRHAGVIVPLPQPGESRKDLRNTSFAQDVIILDDDMSILTLDEAREMEICDEIVDEFSADNIDYLMWVLTRLREEGRLESTPQSVPA